MIMHSGMRYRESLLAACLLATCLLTAGAAYSQEIQKVTTVEGITEYALPNGLRVLLFPDRSKPQLTVNITYLVGSRHEGSGEGGMAHLLEHLLFLQTGSRPSIKKELTDHGARYNGGTSWDRTNYFETVASSDENLQWAIELEADRMRNARLEKSILDTEMTVVRNEFEARENSPSAILTQRVFEAAYTTHNYGKLPIGSRSDIENVPIEKLAAFYRKYYQPDNAVLTISGKFEDAKALALLQKAFGGIPKPQRKLDRTYTVEPVQDGEREVVLRRVGDVQSLTAVYHVPADSHPDSAPLAVLADVLGDTPSGRLYKGLVDNKKAVSAGMFHMGLHDPGLIVATVSARKDQSLEDARKEVVNIIEGIVKEPPTRDEVERAKTKILKSYELQLTDSLSVGLFMSEYLASGDWRLLFHQRDELKKVTEQDVLRVAKAYLKSSNRTIGLFYPTTNPDRAEIPANPDVSALLKDFKGSATTSEGEDFDPTPANIEKRVTRSQLPGGLKLVLLPKKIRGDKVFAHITIRYGDEKSLMGKSGAAQLAGAMLMRGTATKNRQQIQDETNRLKARVSVFGGKTSATATIETTEPNLVGAIRLAAEILRTPSFPENELDQVRQQFIAGIERNLSEPQSLASSELQRHLSPFPRGDVREIALPPQQIEDLKSVTLADVRAFYQQFYGASNGEFAAAGQFDPNELRKLAAELFGDWKSASPFQRVTSPYAKVEPATRNIETPDKKNAVVMAGMRTKMSDEDASYTAASVAVYLFGGSSSSRLYKRIRDKEGLSYGVSAGFGASPKEDNSVFLFNAICAPENAPKVDASFRDELARTLKDGFSEEELSAAKKALLQSVSVARAQDQNLIRMLASHESHGRTMKFDQETDERMAALTAGQVSDAFRKVVALEGLTFFRAGDFKKAGVLQ